MVINVKNSSQYGLVFDGDVKAYVYGAKQLNKYLEKCLGFCLDEYDGNAHYISIGYNEKSKSIIDSADKSTLKRAGLRITFKDGNVYIYGGSEIGTVYGVFEFCERYLGVKFLTSTFEVTPKSQGVEICEIDVECNPQFEQRECAHFSFMVNPDFVLKRRYEGGNTPNHEEAGIITNTWYNKISNSHNSFCYVPKDKYYKTHPEIFSVPNPEKKNRYKSELDGEGLFLECCYSNGLTDDGKVDESLEVSAVKAVADSLYNYIKEDLNIKYFMFGRQDNEGAICYCDKCIEKRKKYGGEAGTMIIFLNAVIELVEKRLIAEGITPDFNLVTFAYQSTFQAPVDKDLKPIDKLIIPNKRLHFRYAPHHKNTSYGVMDEKQDKGVKESIIGWSNLTPNVMVWDYPVHYMDTLFFTPTYLHLAQDIEYYGKIGVSYLMYEEAYSSTQAYNIEMDSYVMSKLFWNPQLDVYDLMKEYCDGFYGVAGKQVYGYRCKMLEFFKNKAEKELFIINPVTPQCEMLKPQTYPLELLTDCVRILEDGLSAIEQSDLTMAQKQRLTLRLKKVMLSPLRTITRNKEYYFGDKITEYQTKFDAIVVETGYQLQFSPVIIMEGNVPNYQILVDKNDEIAVKYANYLNEWFKNKTGVALDVVNWDEYYPTYAVKVICVGDNQFAREMTKDQGYTKYRTYVKNRGWSVFIEGNDLESSCDLFTDYIKDKTWSANQKRLTTLTYEYRELVEFDK